MSAHLPHNVVPGRLLDRHRSEAAGNRPMKNTGSSQHHFFGGLIALSRATDIAAFGHRLRARCSEALYRPWRHKDTIGFDGMQVWSYDGLVSRGRLDRVRMALSKPPSLISRAIRLHLDLVKLHMSEPIQKTEAPIEKCGLFRGGSTYVNRYE